MKNSNQSPAIDRAMPCASRPYKIALDDGLLNLYLRLPLLSSDLRDLASQYNGSTSDDPGAERIWDVTTND